MQAYRDMDIGTAKPTAEERRRVRHDLVDLADPADDLTVAQIQRLGRAALDRAQAVGEHIIIAGGSGLHFRALVDPLEFPPSDPEVRAVVDALSAVEARQALEAADPDAEDHIDLDNPRRVQRALEIIRLGGPPPSERLGSPQAIAVRDYQPLYMFTAVGLDPGPKLEARVRSRFQAMLDNGLLDEVAALVGRLGRNASQAVGYKELLPAVAGECELKEATEAAVRATVRLARRQRTFFRRDPRITWIGWHDDPDVRYGRAREVLEAGPAWNS